MRAFRDHRPLLFFGIVGTISALLALVLSLFLGWHYLETGKLTPHKWAGFMAGFFVLAAMLSAIAGVIGDMLNRHRVYLEEVLYRVRSDLSQSVSE